MKKSMVVIGAVAAVAIVVIVVAFLYVHEDAKSANDVVRSASSPAETHDHATGTISEERHDKNIPVAEREDTGDTVVTDSPEASPTEDEKREAEEEKLVNDFDDLTDKWMEPSAKGVKMEDIDNFTKSFRRIPKARRDECIHRALNLVPDENVMLLAGVLMDKSMDKEIVETVYNDILNRDEDVKKPILKEIFKDKSHPCWTDTAWILDVTGELPKGN